MSEITKEWTLEEILDRIGCPEREYMINPMEVMDYEFISDEGIRKQIEKIVQGRKFRQLKLEEIARIFVSWNLPSVIEGLDYLVQRADKGNLFFDIWDTKEDGKMRTGFTAFPVERKAKFVVICPGGAYQNVCSIAEGFPLAMELNRLGYAAFILQYRTERYAEQPAPMEDLARAVAFILEHAEEFQVETEGYAVLGFSAGGHLAAAFGTKNLGYERYGLPEPEMVILGYPVITMDDTMLEVCRNMPLGTDHAGDMRLREQYSIEKQADASYPPTYLWQCEEDASVPVENSQMMAEVLKRNQVPCEYELFPGPDHGWGLGTGTAAEGWVERAVDFWKKNEKNRIGRENRT